MKVYQTQSGPAYATSSCSGGNWMNTQLSGMQRAGLPFQGSTQMFTGCGNGYGTVGLAYVGTICKGGYAVGVNQMHNAKAWLTFAHELGHNFDGAHSFEQGQGRTGGIMDYGDGKLNGAYQFNTRYRKGKMCRCMSSNVNNCRGKFVKGGGGRPSPSPSPSP